MGSDTVLVLFGGCPPEGWDLAARAWLDGIAGKFLLVGGAGHTTPMLRRFPRLAGFDVEADMMAAYLAAEYGITDVLMERESTNSGNNITFTERTIRAWGGGPPESMILIQDASMQQRMDAVVRAKWTYGTPKVVNFAGTSPRVEVRDGKLAYTGTPHWGAWDLDHWISLLMGEIPRLSDTPDGYGPRGRDFLAHVDIPDDVLAAFDELRATYDVRPALGE
ncbi:ElyC/SanA/YdcF family protein [Winogradskya humida]|uniref:DUF218 domain-containing protein n=1 Tax=Winogradskya humida TaxID=113566 RepID=A0ABQ3ZU78_9ACTN|nr:ElyC/SanA/YdcF family protein [Actinoplanes humidus]GIE21712.1 hypothetical protein Ahu01nite_048140 [Actinoplanes humidus]